VLVVVAEQITDLEVLEVAVMLADQQVAQDQRIEDLEVVDHMAVIVTLLVVLVDRVVYFYVTPIILLYRPVDYLLQHQQLAVTKLLLLLLVMEQ
jgi:hypothetical protein